MVICNEPRLYYLIPKKTPLEDGSFRLTFRRLRADKTRGIARYVSHQGGSLGTLGWCHGPTATWREWTKLTT